MSDAPYARLSDLRSQLGGTPSVLTPAYRAKMLHAIPAMPTVDRAAFIVKRCAGKRVLEFGASGPLHEQIRASAAHYEGADLVAGPGVRACDLDDVHRVAWPLSADADLLVCGELLEHLSNPGWFLTRLRGQYAGVPVLITVPNALAAGRSAWLKQGLENVNADHVAWYSPRTLQTLLTRAGYTILDWACYTGTAPYAEGLIVVAV